MLLEFDSIIAAAGVIIAVASLIFVLIQLRRSLSHRSGLRRVGQPVSGRSGDPMRPREVPHTEVRTFRLVPPGTIPCQIGVITGDILRVKQADIWVNAENTDMEMARITENSVSAIIRYWGAERDSTGHVISDLIAEELASVVGTETPVAPGSAFVTGSGALKASNHVRHIVHVAAVQGEPGAGFRQVRNVGKCVTNALIEADRLAVSSPPVESIIFPLLGTGVGGAEIEPTVHTLLGAAINYLDVTPNTALRAIYFLAYTDVEFDIFMDAVRLTPRLVAADASDSTDTTAQE